MRRSTGARMGDAFYEKLGNEPNIERTWGLLRETIGEQLLDDGEFVPVPFIESAAYYNQLFVFIKKPNILSTLGIHPPTYKVVANMDYLTDRTESTWSPQFEVSPWDIVDGQRAYNEYNLHVTSNRQGPLHKFIKLQVSEPRVRSVPAPTARAVKIYRNLIDELRSVKSLYVITDVMLASSVNVVVRIGNQRATYACDRDTPIGFKYKKYKLNNAGMFVAELQTDLRADPEAAIWLQPVAQPIPDSLTESSRQNNPGRRRRKLRSNLTLPTLHEDPMNVRLRMGEADNRSRIARPVDNDVIVQANRPVQLLPNNFLRQNWSNEVIPQNQPIPRRRSISLEAFRGSDDE